MQTDHSSLARQVFIEMNKVRTNPSSMVQTLQRKLQFFTGRKYFEKGMKCPLVTNEGEHAVLECIQALRNQQPLPPMTLNPGLSQAAEDHCRDHGPHGKTGHTGSDGSSMGNRIEKHGEWLSNIGENISYGKDNGLDVIVQLLVDDGVSSRGHRHNLLSTNYHVVGISSHHHGKYDHMCVMDFAGGFNQKGSGNQNGNYNPPQNYAPPQHYAPPKKTQKKVNVVPAKPKNDYVFEKNHHIGNQRVVKHNHYDAPKKGAFDDPFFSDMKMDMDMGFGEMKMDMGFGNMRTGNMGFGNMGSGNMGGSMKIRTGNSGGDKLIPGAVSCIGTSMKSNTVNGRTVKKVTKKYMMKDGSTQQVTEETKC